MESVEEVIIEDTENVDDIKVSDVNEAIELNEGDIPVLEKKKKKLRKKDSPAAPRILNYYEIDISEIPSAVFSVNKFMALNPKFFKTNVDKRMVYINNNIYYVYSDNVYFKDTIHSVSGFISSSYENNEYKMSVHVRLLTKSKPQPKAEGEVVEDNSGNSFCYIKQIENYVNNQLKHGNFVELYYNKILSGDIIKYCFYSQPNNIWTNDVKTLQEEFFLPGNDHLMTIINNKTDNSKVGNITNSWNNLILHGPPGLGKSTFIYRTAMSLKLSILSVDLSLYLNKRKNYIAYFIIRNLHYLIAM